MPYISIYSANGGVFSSVNGLHFVGVTGSYEGDEEVAVLVRETESMHKFQIILDFQLILRSSITVRLYVDKIHNSTQEGLVRTQNINS